jgi:hypothetical protein
VGIENRNAQKCSLWDDQKEEKVKKHYSFIIKNKHAWMHRTINEYLKESKFGTFNFSNYFC